MFMRMCVSVSVRTGHDKIPGGGRVLLPNPLWPRGVLPPWSEAQPGAVQRRGAPQAARGQDVSDQLSFNGGLVGGY